MKSSAMAKCDQGYLCEKCQEPVTGIINSSLYLSYIIGEVEARQLLSSPDRHLLCNPELSQYITDAFIQQKYQESGLNAGIFAKEMLDPEFVQQRTDLVSRGYVRLKQVVALNLPVSEYPLQQETN
jgi:hypothetical protein